MSEYPKPVSKQSTLKILRQMDTHLFGTIKDIHQICLFTKIKYKTINIPIMISNYQIINYIANNNIDIYINNELNKIEIGRVKYFNIQYDLAVIEIKENNKINYLELDDNLYEKEIENYYEKESIYILNYNNKNEFSVAYSIINNIYNSEIRYPINLKENNNFHYIFPIFNLSNNKLIGIHNNNRKFYNKGLLFKFIYDEFINEYKNTKIKKYEWNEINITIVVNKNEIKEKIYYLDKENNNKKLRVLNDNNSELYIDNIKNEYKKYFIPKNEGEYNIKLIFKINLTDCSYMFANCENIIKINFIHFNSSYITTMKYMFYKCSNLENINLFLFDTKNVIDMTSMFSYCYNLNYLDLSSFDIRNVKRMKNMFNYCYYLKNIKFFSMNSNNIINTDYVFTKCNELNPFYYINKDKEIICKYSNEIDILIKVKKTDINNCVYFLENYNNSNNAYGIKLSYGGIRELDESNTELFINDKIYECKKYFIPEKEGEYNIKLKFNINLTDCSYMFANCKNIIKINFIRFNTSYVRNMQNMFSGCYNLINLDLSNFDTKNVTNMSYLFSRCSNLTNLNLSSFDTKNVENMKNMFDSCNNLIKLDLSNFNTKNVNNMNEMFLNCNNLISVNLSSFDTKNVTDMSGMFWNCRNLTGLDLSSFDTKNVINIISIFYNCSDNLYEFNKSKFIRFKKENLTQWHLRKDKNFDI